MGAAVTKPTPIIEIATRLRRLPLHRQVSHLQALVRTERPNSVRRAELETLLRGKLTRQLRRENRQTRNHTFSS